MKYFGHPQIDLSLLQTDEGRAKAKLSIKELLSNYLEEGDQFDFDGCFVVFGKELLDQSHESQAFIEKIIDDLKDELELLAPGQALSENFFAAPIFIDEVYPFDVSDLTESTRYIKLKKSAFTITASNLVNL